MFILQTFTTILAFLSFSVRAFSLSQLDVGAPSIIQPNASSVWPIGTQQIVIWNTSNLPSDLINPVAQIILGFNKGNSLNLNFQNPLAQDFNLTDGNVTLTVPNVPPRDDYVIVLFGDSGDASPAFSITRIYSGPDTSSSSAASDSITRATLAPTVRSLSTSSVTIPSSTDISSAAVDSSTVLPPSSVDSSTVLPPSAVDSSTVPPPSGTTTAGSTASGSSTSAGWSLHRRSNLWSSTTPFFLSVAPIIIVFVIWM